MKRYCRRSPVEPKSLIIDDNGKEGGDARKKFDAGFRVEMSNRLGGYLEGFETRAGEAVAVPALGVLRGYLEGFETLLISDGYK